MPAQRRETPDLDVGLPDNSWKWKAWHLIREGPIEHRASGRSFLRDIRIWIQDISVLRRYQKATRAWPAIVQITIKDQSGRNDQGDSQESQPAWRGPGHFHFPPFLVWEYVIVLRRWSILARAKTPSGAKFSSPAVKIITVLKRTQQHYISVSYTISHCSRPFVPAISIFLFPFPIFYRVHYFREQTNLSSSLFLSPTKHPYSCLFSRYISRSTDFTCGISFSIATAVPPVVYILLSQITKSDLHLLGCATLLSHDNSQTIFTLNLCPSTLTTTTTTTLSQPRSIVYIHTLRPSQFILSILPATFSGLVNHPGTSPFNPELRLLAARLF